MYKFCWSICLSAALSFLIQLESNGQSFEKIDPLIHQILETQHECDFFVILKNKNPQDLQTNMFWTKEQKATYVYDWLVANAKLSQASIIDFCNERNIKFKSFFLINGILVKGDAKLLDAMSQRSDVLSIRYNVKSSLEFGQDPWDENALDLRSDPTWGIIKIGANTAWAQGYKGKGVTIGGADTGIEWTHPAIQPNYRGYDQNTNLANHSYNWHDAIHEIHPLNQPNSTNPCGLSTKYPCDDNNHGTHTVGTFSGLEGDQNLIGVAPESKWIGCRNMERGYGSMASYIECFEFFMAPTDTNNLNPKPYLAPHVINNSWSCPEIEGCNLTNFQTMTEAIDRLKQAGIVVVVSAGNDGGQCGSINTVPAMVENAFSVGAIKQNDTIASFSSWGPILIDGSNRIKPNISAPGVGVRSCIRNNGYANFNGTSMAGPHVAGAVALLISSNIKLSGRVELIEEILEKSARPMFHPSYSCSISSGTVIPNPIYGYGILDIEKAIQMAKSIDLSNSPEASIVNIFPNPTSDYVEVLTRWFGGETNFEIFSIDGKRVLSNRFEINNYQISTLDLRGLASGTYIIKVYNEKSTFYNKLIKI